MTFTDAQVEQGFASSSAPINSFIEEGVFSAEIVKIAEQYGVPKNNLQAFVLLCRNALIGLVPPNAFSEELRVLGIPAATIPPLATDFHEKIIRAASEFVPPQEDAPLIEPSDSVLENSGVEQRMLPEGHHEIQKTVVVAPKIEAPVPIKVTPVQQVTSVPPPSNYPRTMASDVEAMQGGGKPATPRPIPPPAPRPMPPPRPAPTVAAVQEDMKKYGVDPYREPLQ